MKHKEGAVRKVIYDKSEMVCKATFTPTRDISCDADLQPGQEYIITVATFEPGQITKFWLDIYSEEHHTCVPIPLELGPSVTGEWRGAAAGGCYNHSSWVNNPKYTLSPRDGTPSGPVKVTVLLRQEDRPQKHFIGMYTGRFTGKVPNRNDIEQSSTCINAREVNIQLTLQPNQFPQFIMPTTFEPGQECKFEMTAYSSIPLKWNVF